MGINASYPTGTPTGNIYLDSLIWGGSWAAGPNQITNIKWTVGSGSYTKSGESIPVVTWQDHALNALQSALQQWSNVCNINFTYVADQSQADLVELIVDGKNMPSPTLLGLHFTPDGSEAAPLIGFYNASGKGWTTTGLQKGGYGYATLIHELGHALGLAHSADGGSRPDATAFPGAKGDALGEYDLNQAIWTVMSYNDGWKDVPSPDLSVTDAYGHVATPMAFDVAAIQAIYGVNKTYRTGADTYSLPTGATSSTDQYWSCIWDAGGIDTISGEGGRSGCIINLNAAPLTGPNAGGYVSRVSGVVGGFTIANGVTIENATGTNYDDTLTGNGAANILRGLAGNDSLDGGDGIDTAAYSAGKAAYSIEKTATGFKVSALAASSGNDGIDTLANIERLQFTDTCVALDTGGNAGQVYRLYQAAFNRTPDKGGLGDWIYGMDNGMSLLQVSAGFIGSAEFGSVYGQSPTDSEIVTRFYQNVLHRAPEQAGYDYWMNQLQSGLQTRTQVLTGFSESPENQAQVIGVIQNGMEYTQHAA